MSVSFENKERKQIQMCYPQYLDALPGGCILWLGSFSLVQLPCAGCSIYCSVVCTDCRQSMIQFTCKKCLRGNQQLILLHVFEIFFFSNFLCFQVIDAMLELIFRIAESLSQLKLIHCAVACKCWVLPGTEFLFPVYFRKIAKLNCVGLII